MPDVLFIAIFIVVILIVSVTFVFLLRFVRLRRNQVNNMQLLLTQIYCGAPYVKKALRRTAERVVLVTTDKRQSDFGFRRNLMVKRLQAECFSRQGSLSDEFYDYLCEEHGGDSGILNFTILDLSDVFFDYYLKFIKMED